jgi:penicillin-binding protein 2
MFGKLLKKFQRKNNGNSENIFWGGGLGLEDRNLKERSKTQWVEATFVDFSEEELSSTDKNYLGLSLTNRHFAYFFGFITLMLLILFGRAFYLQGMKGEYYLGIAEKNRIRIYNLTAPRGIIYDRNGEALVKNIPNFALFIVPYDLKSSKVAEAAGLAWLAENLTPEDFADMNEKLDKISKKSKEYFEPVLIKGDFDFEKAMALRIESVNYPGIEIEVAPEREYLMKYADLPAESLSHLLGYVGRINPEEYQEQSKNGYLYNDNLGKTGLELVYEKILRGKYGKEQIEIDSTGKAVKILAKEDLQKGDNLYLSIDAQIQAKLESLMKNHMAKIGKRRGSAVVMDPNNGEILAMVSLPAFDDNLFAKGISQDDYSKLANDEDKPLFNRAVSGEYPSGSVIKPVIAAAALTEGIVKEWTAFLSVGGIRIGEWFYPDWRAGGHGMTDVRKALADSVNTYFYIVGGGFGDVKGLGVYKIDEYLELFGIGKPTGIDLPNELDGLVPTPEWKEQTKNEKWYIGDTYHLAIGQGDLLVTPLQVANYTAVFANRGKLLRPRIVDRVYNQKDKKESQVETEYIKENFIDQDIIGIIRSGMRQCVTTGSGKILRGLPVTSAAKTGTAQWGLDKTPHAWFTSFAPYENPELVLTILIDEAGEGSAVAAPIAYEFYDWYFDKRD